MLVYTDGLVSPWQDWSWSLAAHSEQQDVALGATALHVTLGPKSGVKFQNVAGDVPAASFATLCLHLRPAGEVEELGVWLENGGPAVRVRDLRADTWTAVRIPLATLNPLGAAFSRIELLATTADLYIDAVWLEAAAVEDESAANPGSTGSTGSNDESGGTGATGQTSSTGSTGGDTGSTSSTGSTGATGGSGATYCGSSEKIDLWRGAVKLRGANIMYEYTGGAVWPSYAQTEIDLLASWGANYVEISGAGIFKQTSPYTIDEGAAAELARVLDLIYAARMWAVIGFRSGPGRPEDTFINGGTPAPPLWTNATAQAQWTEMWKETARRFKDHPAVAAYQLMVEPETQNVSVWKTMAQDIVAGIRSIDATTPIHVGGAAWQSIDALANIPVFADTRIVYGFHQYEPFSYTHSGGGTQPTASQLKAIFDPAVAFQAARGNVPLVMSEFGVQRNVTNDEIVLEQEFRQADRMNAATALWLWQSPQEIYWYQQNPWTVQFLEADMQAVIKAEWAKNTCRPD